VSNVFQVVNRCFQILQTRTEDGWRKESDLVIAPDVSGVDWDGFESGPKLIEAGEAAAEAALPILDGWLKPETRKAAVGPFELSPASLAPRE